MLNNVRFCFGARESGMASTTNGSHARMKELFGGEARSGIKCHGVEAKGQINPVGVLDIHERVPAVSLLTVRQETFPCLSKLVRYN